MCCIGLSSNIILYMQDKKLIAQTHFLQYYFSALLQTKCMFWNIFCTGFLFTLPIWLVLWSNYNVVDPFSLLSQPINSNCWRFPSSPATELGRTSIFVVTECIDTPSSVINNFTMLKGIFSQILFTQLPIGALLCEALENLGTRSPCNL